MKLLVVFHPTPFCNLDCTYCWAPDRVIQSKMLLSIVERTLKNLYSNPNITHIDFCWLTGEPLVMGLEYYKEVVELCDKLKPVTINISFSLQTNGTLLNEEWAIFFKKKDFVIGVSIDGPKEIHDKQRKNKAGKATFEKALNGINLLIKHEVKGGALCVITKNTLELSPEELFFFFQEKKISWSYLIEARIGENTDSGFALSPKDLPRLRIYLNRLMDLWASHPNAFIKDFDFLAKKLFGVDDYEVDYDNLGCLDILNVTAEGDFYWGNPELMTAIKNELGYLKANILSTDLFEFRQTPEFKKFRTETFDGIEKCRNECEFFAGCRGGNPSHKYYHHKRFDVTSHLTCELNDKVISELLLSRMENELDLHQPILTVQ